MSMHTAFMLYVVHQEPRCNTLPTTVMHAASDIATAPCRISRDNTSTATLWHTTHRVSHNQQMPG